MLVQADEKRKAAGLGALIGFKGFPCSKWTNEGQTHSHKHTFLIRFFPFHLKEFFFSLEYLKSQYTVSFGDVMILYWCAYVSFCTGNMFVSISVTKHSQYVEPEESVPFLHWQLWLRATLYSKWIHNPFVPCTGCHLLHLEKRGTINITWTLEHCREARSIKVSKEDLWITKEKKVHYVMHAFCL